VKVVLDLKKLIKFIVKLSSGWPTISSEIFKTKSILEILKLVLVEED